MIASRLIVDGQHPKYRGGQGGWWTVAQWGGHVLLRFCRAETEEHPVFVAEMPPGVAVQIAQALVKQAMAAGHAEPVTFTLGERE